MSKLKIEYVEIDSLEEWPDNPKLHDNESIENSIKEFDITKPILVQKSTRRIIAGNGRVEVLKGMGYTEVPVIFLDMDDIKAKAYMLVDNQLPMSGGWDDTLLKQIIAGLKFEAPDLKLDELGFKDLIEGIDNSIPDMLYSQEDMKDAKKKLDTKKSSQELNEIVCPHCGKTFMIEGKE